MNLDDLNDVLSFDYKIVVKSELDFFTQYWCQFKATNLEWVEQSRDS